jgi:hypothetical protein
MSAKKIAVEIICWLLVFNFFYEGVYKVAYLHNYGLWLHHAPFLGSVANFLLYGIPVGEIALPFLLLMPAYRKPTLYFILAVQIFFVLYIMSGFLFSHLLFWPFHAPWNRPTWMQKMTLAIVFSWAALAAIFLSGDNLSIKIFNSKKIAQQAC